jgi:hypothetical protein
MHLAVEHGRHEAEQVLLMELGRDLGEGGVDVVGQLQLDVAAARALREPGQRPVRRLRHLLVRGPHADAVDHHVARDGARDDGSAAGARGGRSRRRGRRRHRQARLAASAELTGARLGGRLAGHPVLAVAQHDEDAAVGLASEREDAFGQRVPEPRLEAGAHVERIAQVGEQLVAIGAERLAHLELIRETRDARAIARQHPENEAVRAVDERVPHRPHARAAVEQEQRRQLLGRGRELRERLDLALVADFEVVARQIDGEVALPVAHRDVDRDRARAAAELRLLERLGPRQDRAAQHDDQQEPDAPGHRSPAM